MVKSQATEAQASFLAWRNFGLRESLAAPLPGVRVTATLTVICAGLLSGSSLDDQKMR